jgi:hypothetical protein
METSRNNGQTNLADTPIGAPELDARSPVFTRVRITRRAAVFLNHIWKAGVHVCVKVHNCRSNNKLIIIRI